MDIRVPQMGHITLEGQKVCDRCGATRTSSLLCGHAQLVHKGAWFQDSLADVLDAWQEGKKQGRMAGEEAGV